MTYKGESFDLFTKVSLKEFENDEIITFLHKQLADYYQYDSTFVNEKPTIVDISDIDNQVLDKHRLDIVCGNTKFPCLFIKKTSKNLLVLFSGARMNGAITFPRWSWYPNVDASVLVIDDPCIQEYKEQRLQIGWYYGNKSVDYLNLAAQIVTAIKTIIAPNNVMFLGSSGGGYASLAISKFFNSGIHIALNPQIFIEKHPLYAKFSEIMEVDLYKDDKLGRNKLVEVLNKKKPSIFIVQNILDTHHANEHVLPLFRELNVENIGVGLNKKDNILSWMIDSPLGHNGLGDRVFFSYILYFAEKFLRNNNDIGEFDRFLSLSLSLILNEKDNLVVERDSLKKNFEEIILSPCFSMESNKDFIKNVTINVDSITIELITSAVTENYEFAVYLLDETVVVKKYWYQLCNCIRIDKGLNFNKVQVYVRNRITKNKVVKYFKI